MKFLKKLGKIFLIIVVICLIYKGILIIYLKSTPTLEIGNANNILLYDKDSKLYFQGNKSKEWISLKNISKYAKEATIYTEDNTFINIMDLII